MDMGPVELIVLVFPGERADPAVVAALQTEVAEGHITILDLMVVTRDDRGDARLTDFDEDLSSVGLSSLGLDGRPLLSDADMELARDLLPPASCAVVVVYEESWARRLAGAVRTAGGGVALHVQLPSETVGTPLAAASAG